MFSGRKLLLLTISALLGCGNPALAQAVTPAEAKAAQTLYTQRQYAAAADAFEKIIARQPTASYLYYAALSCRAARREMRARQLFEYIVAHFPTTQEAAYAKQATGSSATASAASSSKTSESSSGDDGELPDSVKALIPPEMQAMMGTAEGRRAVADAMKENSGKLNTIRQAERAGKIDRSSVKSAMLPTSSAVPESPMTGDKEHPFTAADIAKQGAAAIDQMYYGNCWFECSMAALSELPRGQKLIASMIRGRGKDTYVVRFPGDGVEYVITLDDLKEAGIHDSGLWASLIEAAQVRKFPNNRGADGAEGDTSRLEIGLGCITGAKAEQLNDLTTRTAGEISSFIGGAVKSQNPIVCGTYPYATGPVVPQHAYTVVGFDPSTSMITIRNPHGRNSQRFMVKSDPHHLDFEQLDDGKFKMSVRAFQKNFYSVARSFI